MCVNMQKDTFFIAIYSFVTNKRSWLYVSMIESLWNGQQLKEKGNNLNKWAVLTMNEILQEKKSDQIVAKEPQSQQKTKLNYYWNICMIEITVSVDDVCIISCDLADFICWLLINDAKSEK